MTVEEMRQLIRRMSHAIENVLEGAEIDDGIVSVSALYRLDELYEQDIRPLGPSRMPEVDRSTDCADLVAKETERAINT